MASADDLEQKLTCSICLQVFQEPRLLPCGHTFCQACLARYILSRPPTLSPRGQQGFLCPICREFVPASDRLTSQDKWAACFKPNFLIRDIIELCERSKMQRPRRPVCSRHQSKALELYCRDCRVAICDRCATLDHRRCQHVVEMADAARQTHQAARQQQQTVMRLLRQLEAKKRRCVAGRRDLERIERDIEARVEREAQEVLRKVAEVVRTRKENLKLEARGRCRASASLIDAYVDKCDELAVSLRALDKLLCGRLAADPVPAQAEEQIVCVLEQLNQAVQHLDSPCHVTVQLVIDDTALTAILANLTLGEISTGVKGEGYGVKTTSASSSLSAKSASHCRSHSADSSDRASLSTSAATSLCSLSSLPTPPCSSHRQLAAPCPLSQRGRVVSDPRLGSLDKRGSDPAGSGNEHSGPPAPPARRHSFTKTPLELNFCEPHITVARRRKSQS